MADGDAVDVVAGAGGHWVELLFLNFLRPRLAGARAVQVGVRVLAWFVGGAVLAMGMKLTAMLVGHRRADWVAWWMGGLAFIGIEMVVHLALWMRGRANFYDGRG